MDHRQSLGEAVESERQPRVAEGRQKRAAEQQKKAKNRPLKKKANKRQPKGEDPLVKTEISERKLLLEKKLKLTEEKLKLSEQERASDKEKLKLSEQERASDKEKLKLSEQERASDKEKLKLADQKIASYTLTFQGWVDQKIDTDPMLFTKSSTSTESQKSCFPQEIKKWDNFDTEVLEHIKTFGRTSTTRQAQDFRRFTNTRLNHEGIVYLVGTVVVTLCQYEELVHGEAVYSAPCRSRQTPSGTPASGAKGFAKKNVRPLRPDVEVKWRENTGEKTLVVIECKRPIWFRESDTALPSDISLERTRCQRAAISQLYPYMVTTEAGFGVLTSLDVSYFMRRCKSSSENNYDVLEISDGICWSSRRPSFLGAMHYLLIVAKDKMRTSYTSHRQATSTGVSSRTGNEDDKAVSRAHGHSLRSDKRHSRNTFSAMQTRSKRHQARSLALQDFAEEDLKLERIAFAQGWSGNVVRGEYHGHRIAVKFAPVNCRRHKALQNEAAVYHVLRDLWGKYIPTLVAHGTTAYGEVVFLATEFVYGSKILDADITPALGTEARAALAALHSHGILHGDLHAGNILVFGDGVRFLDFGFSKRVSSRSECEAEMIELEGMIQRYSARIQDCNET